jgi:hypothetical protein
MSGPNILLPIDGARLDHDQAALSQEVYPFDEPYPRTHGVRRTEQVVATAVGRNRTGGRRPDTTLDQGREGAAVSRTHVNRKEVGAVELPAKPDADVALMLLETIEEGLWSAARPAPKDRFFRIAR